MALIVQKFGGSSVATIDRIEHVAKIVARTQSLGHRVVVVVSAMYGETDRLIQLARKASGHLYDREYDALLASGEQASAALMSMALNAVACPSRSYNASQIGIITDSMHSRASIIDINTAVIKADLAAKVIPVIAGFQGISVQGDITTLGRGGSDITAVMLAALLHADECQIFTDVDGVYTSDPRVVKEARRLTHISFEEMWGLAELGAKVLQKNAVKLADRYHVPIRVLSSLVEGPGTLVTFDASAMQQLPLLSGIAFDRNQAKLTFRGLPDHRGVINTILTAINNASIDVDMIVQNSSELTQYMDFSFTVHSDDYEKVLHISKQQSQDLSCLQIISDTAIAKLSLVGVGMRSHAALASKVFQTLIQEGIAVQLITSSEVKVSAVVAEQQMEAGACLLHAAFNLSSARMEQE